MQIGSDQSEQPSDTLVPPTVPGQPVRGTSSRQSRFGKWLVAGGVVLLLVALFWIGPQVWQLAQDAEALEAWVVSLGWLGPIALIALNAIQIVVAPIPGYVVQVAAGFLFGPLWGGVWGSVGLIVGASIAFWLARFYGRPLAGRLVGHERLEQWERVTHSSSTVVWFVLLLSPIGDLPYFLAGLARVSFIKVLLLTLVVRVPSVFVVAAAGAGVMLLTWWQIALLLVALAGLLVIFLRYQEQIVRWSDRHIQRQIDQTLGS
jgi:uncharacterized membrane protein YdjX (TVP38/TMEM64 family)